MPRTGLLLLTALACVALIACSNTNDPGVTVTTPIATAEPTPTPATPTPTPEPTPDPRPERCQASAEAVTDRLDDLEAALQSAMAGYDGGWAVGMVDLDCDRELSVNPEWTQYTASAGKIVPIIAALRAVEAGELALDTFEEQLILVTTHSFDLEANYINSLVTPAQVQEVLVLAEVSELTNFAHDWRQAFMPAVDLARVWAAVLDGRLLEPETAEYLLDLTAHAEIPEGLETFPADAEIEGYQLGQKAGYYVSDGIPYFLLGAGYLRPTNSETGHLGVALVFMSRTTNPDLGEPQRRLAFPLLLAYVLNEDFPEAAASAN